MRVEEVTDIVNGNWDLVWPDLSRVPEAPTIANTIELGVNHWASIGGAVLPSIRVPVHGKDRSQGKRGARKRERRLRELFEASNAAELAALWWGDYAGAGVAVGGVWVNFEEPDPAKRNPYLMRFDPRFTYPIKDDNGNVKELLVARRISKGELTEILPAEHKYLFDDTGKEDVEEWLWFSCDRFLHALVDVSKDGRDKDRHVVLVDQPNPMGFLPMWETVRPTFDGQRRGIFDQTQHILRTMHRLMLLTVSATEEAVYPALLEWDVANPEQFGPAALIHARSPDAKLEPIQNKSQFDVKDLIARLGEEAQNAASFPRQLQGDPGASIVSARGIGASMGALDARLALAHKQFETFFGKLGGFLLAMDETFCNGDKTILGSWQDDREAETYNPERDVAGAWDARATYGIASGMDPANIETRIEMHTGSGLISRETGRAQLPFLEDPDAEPIRLLREQMQMVLVQSIVGVGDPTLAAKALKILSSDIDDYDELLMELVDEILAQPPAAPEGAGGAPGELGNMPGAAEVAQGAESLARGGIPGNAEQALPPLGQLLGQDARMVV